MFNFLRRNKREQERPEPRQEVRLPAEPVQEREIIDEDRSLKKMETDSTEPKRAEKNCPRCGAPNDTFVSTCWMCKEKI